MRSPHNCSRHGRWTLTLLVVLLSLLEWQLEAQVQAVQVSFGAGANSSSSSSQQVELVDSYPYYIQSPLAGSFQSPTPGEQPLGSSATAGNIKQQRATIPLGPEPPTVGTNPPGASSNSAATSARLGPVLMSPQLQPQPQLQIQQQQAQSQKQQCLYDKRYFLKLDQCLERKPYPTVGLPAFKNEDLLIKRGLSDKYGCSFLLTNGLFKHFAISKYALDSDTQCLDQDKTSQLSIQFTNVTLFYLWQLRCLNYADQLLDDSSLGGRTVLQAQDLSAGGSSSQQQQQHGLHRGGGICVGSSQNFGFASLQMAGVEAQVELSVDIYRNWRVTNVTLALGSHSTGKQQAMGGTLPGDHLTADYAAHDSQQQHPQHSQQAPAHPTSGGDQRGIRDFTFETLDGDELNWRYHHLYENWTRNRLHVNFLEQFRRFLWVSLQRCLSESSDQLPVKLVDLFGHHKYN